MSDRLLPPSRFGAGHTVGGPAADPPGNTAPPRPMTPPAGTTAPHSAQRVALLAFVFVVCLGPLAAPVAVPMAVVARRRAARSGHSGEGLAKAATFIGVAYLALAAVVVLLQIAVPG